MGILAWVVLGLIVGFVARWIVPGEAPDGTIADVVVGIVGALLGGSLYGLLSHNGMTDVSLPSLLCALIGAIVLLWLLRAIRGRPAA